MSETWSKERCVCGKPNWIYCGDPNDITSVGPEVQLYRCWNCKVITALDLDFLESEWEMTYKDDEESEYKDFKDYIEKYCWTVDGLEKPD